MVRVVPAETAVNLSMRTLATWSLLVIVARRQTDGSPAELPAAYGVAVFDCCTTSVLPIETPSKALPTRART